MYPNLTEFFKRVFGWDIPLPIQSYGLFVALAFLGGVWILIKEFKRKEAEKIFKPYKYTETVGEGAKLKDIIVSAAVGFIIGFKLLYAILEYGAFVDNPQAFILSGDGSWWGGIILALVFGIYTYREKNKQKLDVPKKVEKILHPYELAGNILVVAGIFGLLGAKIFHNLEYYEEFLAHPWESLISFSGLTFFGGLIVGGIAVFVYLRKYNISGVHLLDVGAVVMSLSYALGRIGCQVSGDGCWGIENPAPQPEWLAWLPDWTWSFDYPHNILKEGVPIPGCTGEYCMHLSVPVFPTPMYETTMMLVVFGILWFLRKRIQIPGMLFSLYLIFAGFERFFIEKIRVNIPYKIMGADITQAEIISFVMALFGIAGLILSYKYREKLRRIHQ
ncbi:MAG: prolipoprotein diacylglyceryl transferase family protein [Bacteroidota bacterium]|nr:prolipoprotein diacylglyceryl transferase family protein [Bacteroidota bacterium]